MNSVLTLVERWRKEGLELLAPESAASVEETFRRLGEQATPDVIALYALVGGMSEMDSQLWRLWSLEEIEKQNGELSQHGILFSDYLIDSWCFRIKPTEKGEAAVYVDAFNGRKPPRLVAESLSAFFTSYLQTPTSVLLA